MKSNECLYMFFGPGRRRMFIENFETGGKVRFGDTQRHPGRSSTCQVSANRETLATNER